MWKSLLFAAAISMGAAPLLAQDVETGKPDKDTKKKDESKDERVKAWESILKELDTNSDGKISKEEFGDRRGAFNALDKNEDGEITREEVIVRKQSEEERKARHSEWKKRAEGKREEARTEEEKRKEALRGAEKRAEERAEGRRDEARRKEEQRKEEERRQQEEKEKDRKKKERENSGS